MPKGNEQPGEPSTICTSRKVNMVWKKVGTFKGVTSDMAHGQAYNTDVKESANGLT